MARAEKNDLAEIFGYAPDDKTAHARKQWKSQLCPFVGGLCVKHSHPQQDGSVVVYGSCSVLNKTRNGAEEVIICPQRLYESRYKSLHACIVDAEGGDLPIYPANEYGKIKTSRKLPRDYFVLFGHNCGKEISLSNPGVITISLDWIMARIKNQSLVSLIPCEVQSIDITGNYRAAWDAYSQEKTKIPNSAHGMNWANVWKRLIPQLILKSSIASTSKLCKKGIYFVVPDRVYAQFEKIIGPVRQIDNADNGVLTVMTYSLGPTVPHGQMRKLAHTRTLRMKASEFAKSFASGKQLPLGTQLDQKVLTLLSSL
jgi:hypothetical protein